ncbi:MAG: metallophosphoesterase family protein [Caldilineaceae bacterium]|nr:metallophosphoesterase family protein [Caldilineaceae bacterium]
MRPLLRLAFLGDIHGNLPGLEAAVAHLDRTQSPDAVYLLGDLVNRCPWSGEVMDLLQERGWPSISGNHDLIISRLYTPEIRPPFDERSRFPVMYWTWDHLRPAQISSLHELPDELPIVFDGAPPIRLLHGLPGNPFVGVYPENDAAEIAQKFAAYTEPVFISGHTHRPLDRHIDGKRFLNPGAVGLPYNGDPRAHYLTLDLRSGPDGPHWQPTFHRIEYDTSLVPAAYESSGMLAEAGPVAQLYLRTVLNGEPWASDFGFWLSRQPGSREDMAGAVEEYLGTYGPGRWAFI